MRTSPGSPRSAQRRFSAELARLIDHWTGADPAGSREELTQAALRVIFRQLAAQVGRTAPLPEHSDPRTSPAFIQAVEALGRQRKWGGIEDDRAADELLGFVFERSLARKELGAYFTAPDVAAYISRCTLLPRLFALAEPDLDLRRLTGPEGVIRYLPASLLASGRLPHETDYEERQRRARIADTCAAWEVGEIRTPDDCLTWNLDLRRLALDAIQREAEAARRWEEAVRALRVLDPTCGSGDFLLAAYELLALLQEACDRRLGREESFTGSDLLRNLHGIDLLPGAIEVSRMRLYLRALARRPCPGRPPDFDAPQLRCLDFLSEPPAPAGERFDAIIGNPPYVSCVHERARYRALGYETAGGGNLYALVMERSLGLLCNGGRLGMIVPVSSVSVSEFRPLVRLLTQGSAWVSSYSNRPARLFEGVEQRLAIWLAAPGRARRLHVSPYQYWWREERGRLFERLRYCESALQPASGLPVKTGCSTAESILRRLTAHPRRLSELTGPGEGAVWLHDGPTYWVRALPFEPNEGQAPRRSRHYHRLSTPDARSALILMALLNSTTFYLFYTWTSNCRDLGYKDWSGFPLSVLPDRVAAQLAACGERLGERLRLTATLRTRVYPSGEVEYEEYHPARAKELIDEIDRILARRYGFTDEELEYIQNYDLKYRMGRTGVEQDEH